MRTQVGTFLPLHAQGAGWGSHSWHPGAAYNTQGGWNPGAAYNTQGGWNPGAAYNTQGGWNPGSAWNTQGGWNPGAVWNTQGGWNPGAVWNTQGGWNPESTWYAHAGWNPGSALNTQGGWNQGTALNTQGGWNQGTALNTQGGWNPGAAWNTQAGWNAHNGGHHDGSAYLGQGTAPHGSQVGFIGHNHGGFYHPTNTAGFGQGAECPTQGGWGQSFATELFETKNDYVVSFDVPGIDIEDLDISLAGNTIHINGIRKGSNDAAGLAYSEIARGNISRAIAVPFDVSSNKSINTSLENGVLKIRIAKETQGNKGASARKVKIG
jgi:HSP20 family molecular chaperone IbpA